MFPVKEVNNAQLGRLRAPSEADIERRIAAAARTPQQQQVHNRAMRTLEQRAMRYVETQRQDRPVPARTAGQGKAVREGMRGGAPRHNFVAHARYDRAKEQLPSHVAIRRGIDTHVQRNVQREARRERIREVGQQVKQKAVAIAQQLGRTARGKGARSLERQSVGEKQARPAERGNMQRAQALAVQREKAPGRQVEQPVRQLSARQQQQQRGMEQERGRSR